ENAINTMVLIGCNAGSFVAPIALTTGGNLFGGTVKSDFYFMASIFAILLVIVISQKIISRNQTHNKSIYLTKLRFVITKAVERSECSEVNKDDG
ncbi:MFS transporter, partial [Enterococcus faecium]